MKASLPSLSFFIAALVLAPATIAAPVLPSAQAGLAPADARAAWQLPAVDKALRLAEDAKSAKGTPLRYAIAVPANGLGAAKAARPAGEWSTLPDGRAFWRLAVAAPGASSIDVGFSKFFLPHGAQLFFASADGKVVRGPYTDADNTRSGTFWTPIVPGEGAVLELVVPAALREHVALELDAAHPAHRDIFAPSFAKSGSCNVDSICPQGNPIRNQIGAEGRYTVNGFVCSGQLVNNTRGDRKRYFTSAHHCFDSQSEANTVVVYWRYESPTCRTPGSAQSGTPLPVQGNSIEQTGGATLIATEEDSDFTLVELNSALPQGINPYWDGWDRTTNVPTSTSVVHHPSGDEKRIAFDNDAPSSSDTGFPQVPGTKHWRIGDYELGTTEQGSSGSGLLNQDRRLIGFLSGGAASCTVIDYDAYGRVNAAWEGDGTPATRLRDWLDPTGSGAQVLDGTTECAAPTIALDGPTTGVAGQALTFTAVATGAGPFTFAWDVDNDGTTDRTLPNLTSSASISPAYPTATSTNVVVRVTDATGCTGQAQRAINVSAPDIVATAQPAQQVCGDGDAAVEPGERWRIPVRLFNAGGKTLDGGYAVFAPGTPAGGNADAFGHRVIDSTSPGCASQFVDISDQPTLPLVASGPEAGAGDDGHTAPIALGAGAFSFYGQPVTNIVMSTNGYLSTATADSGGDYDNNCALAAPDRGSFGGRLNVQHDDLVVQSGGGLRSRFFATCPRAPDSGGTPRACTVFQWNNMGQFASGGANGNAVFQAIVYAGTNEIVYQYQAALPDAGGSSSIGIQNEAANDRLQYACNTGNSAPAGRAVCLFEAASLPASLQPARVRLDTPAPAVNNLASGQEQTVNLDFRVDPAASCGSPLALRYVGTVDNVAYSLRGTSLLSTTVGAGGACNTSQCPASPTPIVANDGFFANPSRFGNGIGAFNIATSGDPTWFGLWFTGERNRNPTWLALQGDRIGDQAVVPIFRFTRTSDAPWSVASNVVGEAQVSYVNADEYVLTWVLDGVPGGEQQNSLYPRAPRPNPNRTGAWFFPAESGWGTAYDDHVLGGAFDEVGINYLYGGDGIARWTLGATSTAGTATIAQNTFLVHCPSCPNFADFISFPLGAGSVTRTFATNGTGTQTMNIVYPAPLSGTFTRNAVPFQLLTTPQPQGQ
ncbi:MAG TPA: hypothetical protein VFL14_14370 [Xanthomonadales bacterium]|nr:hypothetical protein [Xanthomonadales bacterium]